MTEYYLVRTPEQWDWLVNRFGQSGTQWPEQGMSFEEIRECLASGGFVIVHNDYFPGVGSVSYTATPQNNENVIEVSDLMEDEKMEKIKFTKAMKKEFNELNKDMSLSDTLNEIQEDCGELNSWIYSHPSASIPHFELKFARAWADPSLIETIPDKKWNVKVPPFERTNKYYYKSGGKLRWADSVGNDYEDQQFTTDELKEYGLDDNMYEKEEVKE